MARLSGALSKARARARLVDDLERRLLTLKPLLAVIEAAGVDPKGPDVQRIISHMVAGLYHGILRTPKKPPRPREPGAKTWTTLDDMKLMVEVRWRQQEHDVSERQAIKLIAADSACSWPYTPQNDRPSERRGQILQSTDPQARFEGALWRRWQKVGKQMKEWDELKPELAPDDVLAAALGLGRSRRPAK